MKERIVEMTQSEFDALKKNLNPNGAVTFSSFAGSSKKAKSSGYVSVFMNGETLHIKIKP